MTRSETQIRLRKVFSPGRKARRQVGSLHMPPRPGSSGGQRDCAPAESIIEGIHSPIEAVPALDLICVLK